MGKTISNRLYTRREVFRYLFITYFLVISRKNYTSFVSKLSLSIHDKTAAKKPYSLAKIAFLNVQTTFRRTFLSGELQCLRRGHPITGNSFILKYLAVLESTLNQEKSTRRLIQFFHIFFRTLIYSMTYFKKRI